MKRNLIEDLSKLSNIELPLLEKLFGNIALLIAQYYYEQRLSEDETPLIIELGFASLVLSFEEGRLKFKTVPSPELVKQLKGISKGEAPLLESKLQEKAVERLLNYYKDLVA